MSINRIALYHLETLFWIDRLGTFAAAADRLNATQPAVSARMRELEQRVGTVLFRRDGRSMSLTPAARKLVRECEPLLRQMEAALLGSGSFGEASGVVRIGAGEIAAASVLPNFLARLKEDMPRVVLEVEIDLTATLIQQLVSGRTDIAFAAGPIAHPALICRDIGSVSLIWLARRDVAEAFRRPRHVDSPPLALWTLASHSPIYGRMRDAIAAQGLEFVSLNLCNNARLMIDIVKAGGGVGIFPHTMVQSAMDDGELVQINDVPDIAPIEFQVAMRAADSQALLQQIFERAGALRMHANGNAA